MKTRIFLVLAFALFGLTAALTQSSHKNALGNARHEAPAPSAEPSATEVQNNIKVVPKRQTTAGHECADLGLSVLWATSNIDAVNARGYYGRIVAWGEVNAKKKYTEATSVTYGKKMKDFSGNATYDAAAYCWKNGWRTPTANEVRELRKNCVWTWSHENGRNGYTVVSKINGNYIFLPAVGYNDSDRIDCMNSIGAYWTSTPGVQDDYAYSVIFNNSNFCNIVQSFRNGGCYIRPVHSK